MNAVEIEEAVSQLADAAFDPQEFPFAFLTAFGNKEATVKRLRTGNTNKSDVGGVLQRNNIHIAVAEPSQTVEMLARLRASPLTERQKAKFIFATDGTHFEAEEIGSGEVISGPLTELGNHFGFFLPLAGISTVAEVKNNPIDIKATGRLNRLYVQILKDNPDWQAADKRGDLNRFMARLIFCFFAEDTGIFNGDDLFTTTLRQMTEADGSNTRDVLLELFRSMNLDPRKGDRAGVKSWADVFPYVNGGLFKDDIGCPTFTRTSRAYLLRAGELDWKTINPDIFGSMIQAVADDDERGELGMHYTSVPNIQKVLDPLFLDDLREQLEAAGTNKRKLFNLRQRLSRVRVFDPACGSGNFLVIAYIKMREIEDEIMRRRGEALERSAISLTQFYGIEIKSFAAEIARLSLLIAEFQCDVRFIGQMEARALVLPLHATGTIVTGNALRINWEDVCPPVTASTEEQDLGGPTGRLNLEGGGEEWETYICGNPPYLGSTWQSGGQKEELRELVGRRIKSWKSLDYVAGWLIKGSDYMGRQNTSATAFVSTKSVCQGSQVPILWPQILDAGQKIFFAHSPFRWANLASHNAGVTVVIVGFRPQVTASSRRIYEVGSDGRPTSKEVSNINPYLIGGPDIIVHPVSRTPANRGKMVWGNKPTDGGNFFLSPDEKNVLEQKFPSSRRFVKRFLGAQEFIRGDLRYCLWIEDGERAIAEDIPAIASRIEGVREMRANSKAAETRPAADFPHRFRQIQGTAERHALVVARVSSENREYLPVDLVDQDTIIGDRNFAIYDAPIWSLALIASRIHLTWIATVCVRMRTDFSYSNTLGWNTFPVPKLTETDKINLTRCAEDILLAREAHFPATIAELYDPEKMPADLRAAHDRNDETLERIYIGRRFRNDTERLEKLFDMYSKMTAKKEKAS
ncbi:Type I restriction-modification system methyltransferase subunit [Jannaschia seosinensis]|uniref:site-specific DNA-methyltransferase (adenine-specific) n=1 Tax=Jannaschia seosinensis TaxID=313367 RepID=A0A0M7BDU0_9RHOB|nr:DNA methyltransferase [Jannaschia seosinensis]CUH39952.1 Type I restriction-modification system methyltransferase subunit [Jannaschia seosinensis]